MFDFQSIIDKYYPGESALRDIYLHHCRQVADKALAIAAAHNLPLDKADIEAAAMLHDIGIFLTNAPGIQCNGSEPYLRHGLLGADLLRRDGAPEAYARVAERHTGAGITHEDIVADDLPLPLDRDFMPQTQLERLICYADKFFSKSGDMAEKPLPKVMVSMTKFGPETYSRFLSLNREFAVE
jgi:uncharacterized protein